MDKSGAYKTDCFIKTKMPDRDEFKGQAPDMMKGSVKNLRHTLKGDSANQNPTR